MEGQPTKELKDWQLLDLVASQFERAFAPDVYLNVVGEGSEETSLLEDGQIDTCGLNILETAEGLVMPIEDADDLLSSIVGGWDMMALDGVDEFRVMMFQEVEETGGIGGSNDELFSLIKY